MQKYVFIVVLLLLTIVVFLLRECSMSNVELEEPFTPFIRQQFRQKSRQLRLGLRKRQGQATNWVNRIAMKYGLGL